MALPRGPYLESGKLLSIPIVGAFPFTAIISVLFVANHVSCFDTNKNGIVVLYCRIRGLIVLSLYDWCASF